MAANNDYRDLSSAELETAYGDLSRELYGLRSERTTAGRIEKPHRVRQVRRNIARVLTFLKSKSRIGAR